MENIRSHLEAIHIFAGLRGEVLDDIVAQGETLTFQKGDYVFREGDEGHALFLILAGKVSLMKRGTGTESKELAVLGSGDFFGEMCIVECMPRSADARAVGNLTLFSVTNRTLFRLFQKWPDQDAILLLNIARDLCRRLRRMDQNFAARS